MNTKLVGQSDMDVTADWYRGAVSKQSPVSSHRTGWAIVGKADTHSKKRAVSKHYI